MSKNVKWILGLGCLLPLCCTLFAGAIVGIVFTTIRNSDVTTQAMAQIQEDPRVRDKLGEPIEIGWLITGNISVDGVGSSRTGSAELNIPISGPRGSGDVAVFADLQNGSWNFSTMNFSVDGEDGVIDISKN